MLEQVGTPCTKHISASLFVELPKLSTGRVSLTLVSQSLLLQYLTATKHYCELSKNSNLRLNFCIFVQRELKTTMHTSNSL